VDTQSPKVRRRPFLAPLWLLAAAGVAACALAFGAWRAADTTTVLLVRHAEKQLSTIEDPPLAPQGELRAQRLGQMFGGRGTPARISAIYVSDTRRAQQTAAPVEAHTGLKAQVVPAADVKALARRILDEHGGESVLVIGHSNTIPALVQELAGSSVPPITADDYASIYIVSVPTFGRASVLRLEY
jgi:broad specificity phosphatase PhoE